MKTKPVEVWKVGRTSDLTSGTLLGRATGTVEVGMKDISFKSPVHFDDVLIVENNCDKPFSEPGDSGSLVVWKRNGEYEAAGILFCGNPKETYLMPMEEVLNFFKVGIVGNHNV